MFGSNLPSGSQISLSLCLWMSIEDVGIVLEMVRVSGVVGYAGLNKMTVKLCHPPLLSSLDFLHP